ncbi:MAG: tripartite tricarboxylate transporter permease [Synergistaceae bacterium]|nr:tripartite tricarboxylate transporter permease [Synergistaceae bacterium]
MDELLASGLSVIMQPFTLMLLIAGVVVGVVFGALPGVSSSMAVALSLGFTYSMDPVGAIAFMVAVYCAAVTGGGITAILFKIPGTPSNAATTFDGFPMAQRGEADKALGIALICSAIGGLVSAVIMFLMSPQLIKVALTFGPSELFAVCFLGLSILTCLESENLNRCIISGLLGLFLACVGIDPISSYQRFTWGNSVLRSGVEMIPVMIGLFAIGEVLKQTASHKGIKIDEKNRQQAQAKTVFPSLAEWWKIRWTIIRSSLLGTAVGILPGAGSTIAAFLCYASEVKVSKHPERFGTGIMEGIAASETANNAATGGSMVPLLTMGIPGGTSAAIMMSALTLKGVQMGPLLLLTQPQYLSATFISMIITNILMVGVCVIVARMFAKILSIPYSYLGTTIMLLAVIGAFSTKNAIVDVKLMVIAGVAGLVFSACKFNNAALILGLVLGTMCENNLRRAVAMSAGSFTKVFSRPMTAAIMIIGIVALLYPIVKPLIFKKTTLVS